MTKIQEVSEETNFSLELHDASNKEDDIFSFPNGINGDSHNDNNGFDFGQSLASQNTVKQLKVILFYKNKRHSHSQMVI